MVEVEKCGMREDRGDVGGKDEMGVNVNDEEGCGTEKRAVAVTTETQRN